jgi:hypothetical protein
VNSGAYRRRPGRSLRDGRVTRKESLVPCGYGLVAHHQPAMGFSDEPFPVFFVFGECLCKNGDLQSRSDLTWTETRCLFKSTFACNSAFSCSRSDTFLVRWDNRGSAEFLICIQDSPHLIPRRGSLLEKLGHAIKHRARILSIGHVGSTVTGWW